MRQISVSGSPYEIGFQHGSQAKEEIGRGIEFYTELFQKNAGLSWKQASAEAEKFLPFLEGREELKDYVEEMRGVAAGSSQPFPSILAMNVRTELAYGFIPTPNNTDGCTALSWLTPTGTSLLAQNWDWQSEQSPNLIALTITPSPPATSDEKSDGKPKPVIKMITEAGLIGKIGLNSHGVGVTLNAIKAPGISHSKVPCHLALRLCLDSPDAGTAISTLQRVDGVASSCHILVADGVSGGVGVECSAADMVLLPPNPSGQVFHSNHFVEPHVNNFESKLYLSDSPMRLIRIEELAKKAAATTTGSPPNVEVLENMLEDEQGYPTAICRDVTEKSTVASLFSIVMDLTDRKARVRVGRPVSSTERIEMVF